MLHEHSGPNHPDPHQEVVEEHARIKELLGQLSADGDVGSLGQAIGELVELLREHFAREEEPAGFFESVDQAAPRHSTTIDTLRDDHSVMLLELEGIEADWRQLVTRLELLSVHLSEHEQVEHDLMMDAFFVDMGEGD